MIVSTKHKALVLRIRDPSKVTTVIPGAKLLTHNGKEYVVVKHGLDEVKVLNNIGIKAPSPVTYYYKYPGRFKPYAHQRKIVEFLTAHSRAFNLGDIGVGKSISTLWAMDYMKSQGKVNKTIIVSPLSTLERTWADEIFQHFMHYTVVVLHGSREQRLALLKQDADIYLINHDGIKVRGFVEALALRPDINLVIIDELAQAGRNASAGRWKALDIICNKQHQRIVWGLTGTPIPNTPTDAFAQCKLIVPHTAPRSMRAFKDATMRQVAAFKWVPRDNALDVVNAVMQPSIRFHRDDCLDLPPCIYKTMEVPFTEAQEVAYKEMSSQLQTEIAGGVITASNEAIKAMKLIQIALGAVKGGENGEAHYLDASHRLETVLEVINEAPAKVIVFVPFKAPLHQIATYLRAAGVTTEVINGDVPKNQRDDIFRAFSNDPDPKVLVAQPNTMSHGLTLVSASTIIWMAPIASNDIFEQANGRITRPGQTRSQLVVMIEGCAVERLYYKRLQEKKRVQGLLLDMMRDNKP